MAIMDDSNDVADQFARALADAMEGQRLGRPAFSEVGACTAGRHPTGEVFLLACLKDGTQVELTVRALVPREGT